ncbi:MAG: redoxin family protein [Pirellulales bacterium]|nr:redoxin family protein [Pirellulales bacterium]
MSLKNSRRWALLAISMLSLAAPAFAAPSVEDALKLAPVQSGIQFDSPTADEAKACKISPEKIGGATAWVVRGADGAVLRQFSDSNKDNVVDTWSYFRGGLEVYRDADLDYNGKAEQYRWFHTGGSRWALDKNEDGKVDSWKSISAEEASEEVIAALRSKDAARFERLLLTKDEIGKLGLTKELTEKLTERVAAAPKTFAKLVSDGKIDAKAEFTDFGGLRPGAVPAGTRGGTKDLLVYEDVWAMALAGDQPQQLQLGSMVNIDGAWKLVDGPVIGAADSVVAGFFYDAEGVIPQQTQVAAINEPTEEMQTILETIQKLDDQLIKAEPDKRAALHNQRADLLERLATVAKDPTEREQWTKQLVDMVSAAVQEGSYPEGMERLKKIETRLTADKASEDLLTHVEFSRMQAAWGLAQGSPEAEKDYAKIQEAWLKQLEEFVGKHKSSEHVAEALLQLGMASEFAGEKETALKWYQRLVKDFPKFSKTPKAEGSIRRLSAAGKPIPLKGADVNGGAPIDLAQYKGKAVLIHYWSTSLPTIKDDHERIADLYKKYGGANFEVVGVNLDYSKDEVIAYLKANTQLRWKQLFEPGGFESRLANEMGIITLPMVILVNDKGEVVTSDLQVPEIEDELAKLLAERVANAK